MTAEEWTLSKRADESAAARAMLEGINSCVGTGPALSCSTAVAAAAAAAVAPGLGPGVVGRQREFKRALLGGPHKLKPV